MAWHHHLGIGTKAGFTQWYNDKTAALINKTNAQTGLLKAQTAAHTGYAEALEGFKAAKKTYRATTFSGKTLGKFKSMAGWGALGVAGAGALAYLSYHARDSRHVDHLPPAPEDMGQALEQVPDFAEPAGRQVLGPHTARVLGVGGRTAMQPGLMGGDNATSLESQQPAGSLSA